MRYVHAREKIRGGATALVRCERTCQASILDDDNYKLLLSGKKAYCAAQSPPAKTHVIPVPRTDNWNIVLTYEGEPMTLLEYDIGVKDIRLGL